MSIKTYYSSESSRASCLYISSTSYISIILYYIRNIKIKFKMPILHQYEYSGAVASMEFFTVEVESASKWMLLIQSVS